MWPQPCPQSGINRVLTSRWRSRLNWCNHGERSLTKVCVVLPWRLFSGSEEGGRLLLQVINPVLHLLSSDRTWYQNVQEKRHLAVILRAPTGPKNSDFDSWAASTHSKDRETTIRKCFEASPASTSRLKSFLKQRAQELRLLGVQKLHPCNLRSFNATTVSHWLP